MFMSKTVDICMDVSGCTSQTTHGGFSVICFLCSLKKIVGSPINNVLINILHKFKIFRHTSEVKIFASHEEFVLLTKVFSL